MTDYGLQPHEQRARASALRFGDLTYMRHNFPALFAQYAHPKMSGNYGFTDTYHLLQHLQHRGYTLRTVQQTGRGAYGKMLVRMQHPTLARSDTGAAEIVIIDSHDGTSAFTVRLGFIRFACSNGLIISDDVFVRSFKHTQPDLVEAVILDLDDATGGSNDMFRTIERMRDRVLNDNERVVLARDVVLSRFAVDPIADENYINRAASAMANTRRRADDISNDLFTVMNVVQENALREGVVFTHSGLTTKVRTVTSIDKTIAVNKAAWGSAVRILEAA
jgi:hypothetical protein